MKKKHKKGKRSKKYELFDALCQEMEEKDYHMQDKTFSTKEAGTQGNAAASSIYRIGRDWLLLALGSGRIAIMGD